MAGATEFVAIGHCRGPFYLDGLARMYGATDPFELYLEFDQRIKARSKAEQTFLVQLASGSEMYLPSTTAEKFDGYGGLIINGKVGYEGGNQLVDATVKGIAQMFAISN